MNPAPEVNPTPEGAFCFSRFGVLVVGSRLGRGDAKAFPSCCCYLPVFSRLALAVIPSAFVAALRPRDVQQ